MQIHKVKHSLHYVNLSEWVLYRDAHDHALMKFTDCSIRVFTCTIIRVATSVVLVYFY